MAGPMPRTWPSALREPKGPSESRFATIRAASAGPIRGNCSSSSAVATSTSTIDSGSLFLRARELPRDAPDGDSLNCAVVPDGFCARFFPRLLARVESMAESCPSTDSPETLAPNCCCAAAPSWCCSQKRAPPPRRATPARNARACRSVAVGMECGGSEARNVLRDARDARTNSRGVTPYCCQRFAALPELPHVTCAKMQLQHCTEDRQRRLSIVVAVKHRGL